MGGVLDFIGLQQDTTINACDPLCFCAAFGPNLAEEPLTFDFKRKSGPAKDRKETFDVGNVQRPNI